MLFYMKQKLFKFVLNSSFRRNWHWYHIEKLMSYDLWLRSNTLPMIGRGILETGTEISFNLKAKRLPLIHSD
jgi:hypothetical protein